MVGCWRKRNCCSRDSDGGFSTEKFLRTSEEEVAAAVVPFDSGTPLRVVASRSSAGGLW